MPTTNGNTMTYSYDGHLDTFVVQTTGWYDIQAYGAQGGLVLGDPGSYGAAISGDFFLTSGETLDIIVGQQGFAGAGAGGGGGGFVFLPATPSAAASPLVVAGGGGGGSLGTLGGAGQAGTSGANGGASTGRGTGGTNGNGGGAGQSNGSSGPNENGGGGGGFLTAGAIGSAPASPSPANGGGGQAAVAGAAGGGGAAGAGNGGFGGGGGAAGHSGGGGGGYSGGGGGGSFLAGGGGGSFDASIVNNADLVLTTGGATAGGNGLVSFTQVSAPTAFRVGSTADLNAAIQAIDLTGSASALNTAYSITFTKGFTLTQQLYAINLASGDTLTIQGAGTTLDGAGAYNGLFVYAGTVTVQNLTIQNAKAIGGTGSGGGAGLGGGLFIASSGVVTLSNVSFSGDNATGGAANIGGGRGGGGLDGGAGVLGGGGVGLSATGGQVQVHSGGAGIILGAASGGVGWVAFDGFGGANGGGGGSGGHFTQDPLDSGGGGGGVAGGNGSGSTTGGTGGFGGGGGGGDDGGNGGSGGFGGGGGSGDYNGPTSGNGGAGGFGGGGGGTDSLGTGVGGTPGFGGGAAGPYYVSSGSGGLGAGGGIFVQQGGSLTYSGGGVSGGTVTGGSGGTGFDSGGDGSAFGAGLFLQGNQQATLSGPLTIADVIADQSGSGGTGDNAGAGSLLITGAGTVTLFAANTYVGGTTIAGGATFDLGNAKAAGGGAISFAASSSDTLKIESGDAPANVIAGFLPGDTIDLASVGLETTITPGAANAYSFSGGTGPNSAVTLHFNPMENFSGLLFNLAADGNGGTNVTLVVDQAPTVTNLPASQTLNDNQTLNPFANVTLADSDAGQTETITATLKANGVASDANGTLSGMGLMKTGAGTYQLNGSSGAGISALQLALRAAVFTPTGNEVAPGGKVATDVSIAISDGQQTNSAAGTLSVTSINDAPSIMFGAGGQITYDNSTIKPFDTVIVTDPDVGAQDSLTIRLTKAANGTLSGEGLSVGSSGIYTLAATSPATLTKELRALVFTPTANQVAPKDAVLTTFLLSAADGLGGTATNMNTSVLAISVNDAPTIAGTQASQATTDKGTATPFAMVTIADPDVGQTEAATVSFTAANGTLSNLGGGTVGAGSYTVSGTAAAVQMALRGLVFTPTANQVAPGHPVMTGFSLSVSDGTATTVDTHTSVVATSVNDAPTILGTQANQTTTDKGAATPFTMVAIADPDVGQTETATISYNAANGTLSNLGGGSAGAGAYTVSGTAAAVQVALRGLVFTPTANQVAPGQTVTTAFTLSVSDGIATTQNTTTSVAAASIIDAPVISGTKGGQTTTDYVPIKPFANVAVTDVDAVGPGTTDSVAINVLSGGVATDATGKLSGGTGLTKTGTGTYTLTASSPQALTTALEALSFTPTQAQVKAGQTVSTMFQLTPSESAGGSVATGTADGTTSVTVTALNYVNGPANGFGLLTGTTGADVITAHGRFNAIFGLGGNDIVNAGDGNAAVTLGNGNASVTVGGAGNVVIGGNGNMSVTGAPGGFTTVTLGNGNDTVQIGGTNDVILLGNGTNMVSGTQGMAFITTGSGNDTITLGGSGNTVDAGAGQNTIFGGTGSDTFVLPAVGNGFDAISGFTETNGDVLDLRAALAATSWNHQSKTLANYLKVTDSDGSTNLAIAQTGSGSGTAIASLSGTNYGLTDLISHHSLLT